MKTTNSRIVYFLICLCAFSLGYLSNYKKLERVPSLSNGGHRSLASDGNKNISFANLPCPTNFAYGKLKKKIKFVGKLNGELCDGESNKSKFAKLLKFIQGMKVSVSPNWRGGATFALQNTFEYLSLMANKVDFDSLRPGTIALNRGKGDIYLGAEFFHLEPLFALLILIHEARHSSPDAPGHTRCKYSLKSNLIFPANIF